MAGWQEQREAGEGLPNSLFDEAVVAVKCAYPDTAPKPSVIKQYLANQTRLQQLFDAPGLERLHVSAYDFMRPNRRKCRRVSGGCGGDAGDADTGDDAVGGGDSGGRRGVLGRR